MKQINPIEFGEVRAEVKNLNHDMAELKSSVEALTREVREMRRDLERLRNRGWGILIALGALAGSGGIIGGSFVPDLLKRLGN